MISIKVFFENGDSLSTQINTDIDGARRYYIGRQFNLGIENDVMVKAIDVQAI